MGKYAVTAYKEDKSVVICIEVEASTVKQAATCVMAGCLNGTDLVYSLRVCKDVTRCKGWQLRVTDLCTGNTYLISASVKEMTRRPEKRFIGDTLYGMSLEQRVRFFEKMNGGN